MKLHMVTFLRLVQHGTHRSSPVWERVTAFVQYQDNVKPFVTHEMLQRVKAGYVENASLYGLAYGPGGSIVDVIHHP